MSTEAVWSRFPVRCCQRLHEMYGKDPDYCRICGRKILIMNRYYDGGRGRRVHVDCVEESDAKAKKEKEV